MAEKVQKNIALKKVMMVKDILEKENRAGSSNRIRPKPMGNRTMDEKDTGTRFR
jgi:hypothetical protein